MTSGRPVVRRILVLSPRFVPTDAVDLHRIRSNIAYYRQLGWQPTVLAVRPELCGRPVLHELAMTVPDDLDIRHVGAMPVAIARRLGVSALGIRAFCHLLIAGLRILRQGRFDLVYVTTTEFLTMPLAAIWRRMTGVPFVLDFQDPWASDYAGAGTADFAPAKYGIMRRIHRILERLTVPSAAGLVAVSGAYVATLHRRYPALAARPSGIVPFGFNPRDLAVAASVCPAPARPADGMTGVYAGRVGGALSAAAGRLLEVLRAGLADDPGFFGRLRLDFVGTAYQGDRPEIAPKADAMGLSALVRERPRREPYLAVLAAQASAGFIVILGSDAGGYVPSKLAAVLSCRRPIVAFAGRDPEIERVLSPLPTAIVLPDRILDPVATARRLRDFLSETARDFAPQEKAALAFRAESMAAREVEIFDRAVAAAG